jgi:hypothetical protein
MLTRISAPARVLLALSMLLPLWGFNWSAAQVAKTEDKGGPWGKEVDGLSCRLTMQPRYAIGQPIPAVIEVKNSSDKKRYIFGQLDPRYSEFVSIRIDGPKAKIAPTFSPPVFSVNPNWFKPIGPGEVKRFEVRDLREYFFGLDPRYYSFQQNKIDDAIGGKINARLQFRSTALPARFSELTRFPPGGGMQMILKDTPADMFASQWSGEIDAVPLTFELAPLSNEDLVVHEWGVFTILNDSKYANANRKEEWSKLPTFFYRQFPTERLRWIPSGWDKPIINFYSKLSLLRLDVKVTFNEGAPVVWWPAVCSPVEDPWRGRNDPLNARPFRSLIWRVWLGDALPIVNKTSSDAWFEDMVPFVNKRPNDKNIDEGPIKVVDFPLPPDCWLTDARLSSATKVTVVGNDPAKARGWPGAQDRLETERFLYYDGLVPSPDYIRCVKIDDASISLRNLATFDIPRLFVVDRRVKGRVGFAFLDGSKEPLKAGATWVVKPQSVAADDWPAAGIKQVRQALLDVGLFEPEADSLLKIWRKGFFESEGVTAFHILPPAEYDRMLTLEIVPAPAAKPLRVGIALHPHVEIEPAHAERVGGLIRQLDDEKYSKREAASKALLEIGPIAIGTLRAELQKGPSLEMRRRIEEVLNRVDATEWLKSGSQR